MKEDKHFENCMHIQQITISKYLQAATNMGKLYMLTILYNIQIIVKIYLEGEYKHRQLQDKVNNNAVDVDDKDESDSELQNSEFNRYERSEMPSELFFTSNIYMDQQVGYHKNSRNSRTYNFFKSCTQDYQQQTHSMWADKKLKNPQEIKAQLKKNLPKNLAKLFELLMNVAVDDCEEVKDAFRVMFEQYKNLLQHIQLETVIDTIDEFVKGNEFFTKKKSKEKDAEQQHRSNIKKYSEEEKEKRDQRMLVTLECLYELLKIFSRLHLYSKTIINNKLARAQKDQEQISLHGSRLFTKKSGPNTISDFNKFGKYKKSQTIKMDRERDMYFPDNNDHDKLNISIEDICEEKPDNQGKSPLKFKHPPNRRYSLVMDTNKFDSAFKNYEDDD